MSTLQLWSNKDFCQAVPPIIRQSVWEASVPSLMSWSSQAIVLSPRLKAEQSACWLTAVWGLFIQMMLLNWAIQKGNKRGIINFSSAQLLSGCRGEWHSSHSDHPSTRRVWQWSHDSSNSCTVEPTSHDPFSICAAVKRQWLTARAQCNLLCDTSIIAIWC